MAKAKQKRWECPLCSSGVLAPSRPRSDDARRFCLECTALTGKLVRRVCPALERRRKNKATKRASDARERRGLLEASNAGRLTRLELLIQKAGKRLGVSVRTPTPETLAAWGGHVPSPNSWASARAWLFAHAASSQRGRMSDLVGGVWPDIPPGLSGQYEALTVAIEARDQACPECHRTVEVVSATNADGEPLVGCRGCGGMWGEAELQDLHDGITTRRPRARAAAGAS